MSYWNEEGFNPGIFSEVCAREQQNSIKEKIADVEVFKETRNPRILRVFGPWLCYEVIGKSLEPIERFQSFSDAEKYLVLLVKFEETTAKEQGHE